MTLEHEEYGPEPRDYTRYLWVGILAAVLIMIALFAFKGEREPTRSMVRSKHILIKCERTDPADCGRALKTAQELRIRIQNGENFEDLAKEYSNDDFSAERGGDLGLRPKGTYLEQFENYIWNAPLNELGEIVQTAHGYHLIVVTERHISEGDTYEQELERRVTEIGSTPPAAEAPAAAPAPAPAS